MQSTEENAGYPSIDKPWLKYYSEKAINAELPECTLYENVWNNNQDNLDSIALEYYGNKITYAAFFKEIDTIARALVKLGVKRGDVVTVCMINQPEMIFLMYALNKIGATANMISGLSEEQNIVRYINDVQSTILFVLDIFQKKIANIIGQTKLQHVIVANLTQSMGVANRTGARVLKGMRPKPLHKDYRFMPWKKFVQELAPMAEITGKSDDVAVITYTGGTTGGSKGAMLTNKNIISTAQQYIWCEAGLERGQTWVQTIPMFHAFGVAPSAHLPLMAGLTLIIRIPMSESVADICKKYKPNHILHGPAFWERFADDNCDMDLSFLIEPTCGGDKLPVAVEEKINEYFKRHGSKYPLMNGFGMTEVSAGVATNFIRAHKVGSVGIPFCKNIIAAFDCETGEELPYGKEGEICIYTPSMMKGYVNNQEETEVMIKLHSDGRKWVHTGDIGYVDEDGFVFISGRIKRYFLYVANGEQKKVFSLDVEKVLVTHKDVENCAVVPIPDAKVNQVGKAYIKLKSKNCDIKKIEQELRQMCEELLSEQYRPKKYEFVEKYPLTQFGKIDYRALEKQATDNV